MNPDVQWITQFGSLSANVVLTGLFVWLIYKAPEFLERERASREKIAEQMTEKHATIVDKILAKSEEQIRFERESCEQRCKEVLEQSDRHHQEIMESISKNYTLGREIDHKVANLLHEKAVKQAAEEAQRIVRFPKKPQQPGPGGSGGES